jgi:molybdopterin/thiamine biosynthesis adenylyltransferase
MLADYFRRSAVAAAQVLAGFDENVFRERLEQVPVGLSVDAVSATEPGGAALADLAVRLMARLYPTIALVGPSETIEPLATLARAVNPEIEICQTAEIGIVIGGGSSFARSIYAGYDGADALVSAATPQPAGEGAFVFGAAGGACLATAELFRVLFLGGEDDALPDDVRFPVGHGAHADESEPEVQLPERCALIGAGAVGEAALWALSRTPIRGRLHVVDLELVELSNMQRYVLTQRSDEHRPKVDIAAKLDGSLEVVPHLNDLAAFVGEQGRSWDVMLLALDSAYDRVAAQASLPRQIVNAWTQPDDLGVSVHSRFGGPGACVSCLYLPTGPRKNEDELVAETLRVPQLQQQVRTLLATGQPVDQGFLMAVAQATGLPPEDVLRFDGRSVRELYVEGFCGGGLIPLGGIGRPQDGAQEIHVPLAHQSALAGVLLAAALVELATSGPPEVTYAVRTDVLKNSGRQTRQPLKAARDGRCICDDPDFVGIHTHKYGLEPLEPAAPVAP